MMTALPPYLFPSVAWFAQGVRMGKLRVATGGRFEKQTCRSRYKIAGPNALQMLSVPIVHGHGGGFAEVQISRAHKWDKEHIRTWETAYGNSPFYEFYDYRLLPLLTDTSLSLQVLVMRSIVKLKNELKCPVELEFTDEFPFTEPDMVITPYPQVFDDRFGFRPDVSALDLLFNLGPESGDYLRQYALG